MNQPQQPTESRPGLWGRIRRSIWREPWPSDDRGRKRLALNDLILHLHAPTFPQRSLKLTYTFALGGLSMMLFGLLVVSGVLLIFAYTPTPDAAYASMTALAAEVWMGQFVRNLHYLCANALLILAGLHLLRVFFTAAFHPPREFNWVLGLGLLLLVAMSNFTGYLMPWDQRSYWAVTIGTSLLTHIPLVGDALSHLILGGQEVGAATLRNFFGLHVTVLPLLIAITAAYHIWRVRKDEISVPRAVDEAPLPRRAIKRVTTIPHLVTLEMGIGLLVLALLLAGALIIDAPLLDAADPTHPPNPAKAAWYFMGVQELLLHFHPAFVAAVLPGLAALGLFLLPYLDLPGQDVTGVWFRSRRGRWLTVLSAACGVLFTAGFVLADAYGINFRDLLPTLPPVLTGGLLPLAVPLLLLWSYARLLRRRGAAQTEINQAIFTLLLAVFLTLTVIGQCFRGQDMALMFPWEM